MASEPDAKGMTVVEIADAAGVSPYLVSVAARTAKIPRLGPRRGHDVRIARRMVAVLRTGLLNEKVARVVANDLDGAIAASRELTALLEEMKERAA